MSTSSYKGYNPYYPTGEGSGAMHLTDNQNGIRKGSVMDLIYDVSDWNSI